MSERNDNATRPTEVPVEEFLASVEDERRRAEGQRLLEIFRRATGVEPVMWGPTIVGFGSKHYTTSSGREGDWPIVGFSPRKAQLSLYGLQNSYAPEPEPLLAELGPHKTGVGCLYVRGLDKIDEQVLERLVREAWAEGGR